MLNPPTCVSAEMSMLQLQLQKVEILVRVADRIDFWRHVDCTVLFVQINVFFSELK